MRTTRKHLLVSAIAVAISTTMLPAFAQSTAGGTGAGTNTTQRASDPPREEKRDWGWLGLLGLIGLAGLKKRREDPYRPTGTTTGSSTGTTRSTR